MSIDYKPKSDGLFEKIGSEGEALKTIEVTSVVFISSAVIQALIIGLFMPLLLVVPAAIAGSAVVLRVKKSRIAAFVLVGFTILSIVFQVAQMFRTRQPAFGGLIISAVLLWASIRAMQATSALIRFRNVTDNSQV